MWQINIAKFSATELRKLSIAMCRGERQQKLGGRGKKEKAIKRKRRDFQRNLLHMPSDTVGIIVPLFPYLRDLDMCLIWLTLKLAVSLSLPQHTRLGLEMGFLKVTVL